MTTMTHDDNRTTTLKREAVEQQRDALVTHAIRLERKTGPDRGDVELGLTWQDMQDTARAYRADADRLTQVLACIDAGVPELPAQLYPGAK